MALCNAFKQFQPNNNQELDGTLVIRGKTGVNVEFRDSVVVRVPLNDTCRVQVLPYDILFLLFSM